MRIRRTTINAEPAELAEQRLICAFCGFRVLRRGFLQRACERRRALAVAENLRNTGRLGQRRAAVDGRHRQIQLRTFGTAGERDAYGMEKRLTLLTGPRLHLVRDRAKFFSIES